MESSGQAGAYNPLPAAFEVLGGCSGISRRRQDISTDPTQSPWDVQAYQLEKGAPNGERQKGMLREVL